MSGEPFQTCPVHASIERSMGSVEEGIKVLKENFRDFKEDLRLFETRYSSQLSSIETAVRQNSETVKAFMDGAKQAGTFRDKNVFFEFVAGSPVKKVFFGSAGASIFYSIMHFLFKHFQW